RDRPKSAQHPQTQPVWRHTGRPDCGKQIVFLWRLSGNDATPGSGEYGNVHPDSSNVGRRLDNVRFTRVQWRAASDVKGTLREQPDRSVAVQQARDVLVELERKPSVPSHK